MVTTAKASDLSMRLSDKVAVVTGAGRGIGRAVALGLAREGATVFINYLRDAESAGDVVKEIEAGGGKAFALQADVSRVEEVRAFFAEVSMRAPEIDILVNNAGTASTKPQPLGSVDLAEYDRIFDLNTRGLFFMSPQEALRLLPDGGRIVNVSSLASRMTAPGRSVYAGTKGAIEAFTRVWAAELGGRGITVNSVSPGIVETDRLRAQLSSEMRESFIGQTPLARIGQPEDIADAVVFLCSDEGRWMTAQNLVAAGGLG